jgi:4-amino-4-deoxy-L-arabinose transferase-like glycosyltransferase
MKGRFLTSGIVLLFAVVICLLSTLHPFSNGIPWIDSAVFLTIGQKMHVGIMPYSELFDHKGPLLYLINYLGLFFGQTGVWFCELAAMIISMSFAYKTARTWTDRTSALFGIFFLFLLLGNFFSQGNMPEEYALPLIFASLFLYVKHWSRTVDLQPPPEWTKKEIFALGFGFGLSLMLKANLFGIWAGASLVLIIQAVQKKDYKFIRRYVAFFAIGAVAAVAPFLIWLTAQDALGAYIEQNFLFNSKYAAHSFGVERYAKNFLLTLKNPFLLPGILATLFLAWKFRKNETAPIYIATLLSLFLSIALFCSTPYLGKHYSMVLIPLFTPALFFFVQRFATLSKHIQRAGMTGTIIVAIAVSTLSPDVHKNIELTFNPSLQTYNSYTKEKLARVQAFVAALPEQADSAIVLGSNCNLYSCTDAALASKYIYQWPIAEIAPEIANAYQDDLIANKPQLIFLTWPYLRITPNLEIDAEKLHKTFPKLKNWLESEYKQTYVEAGLAVVFERKTKKELDNFSKNHN